MCQRELSFYSLFESVPWFENISFGSKCSENGIYNFSTVV